MLTWVGGQSYCRERWCAKSRSALDLALTLVSGAAQKGGFPLAPAVSYQRAKKLTRISHRTQRRGTFGGEFCPGKRSKSSRMRQDDVRGHGQRARDGSSAT
jgi:hypothetical protein